MVTDLNVILPEIALTVLVLVVLTVDLFLRRDQKWALTLITVAGLAVVGIRLIGAWG